MNGTHCDAEGLALSWNTNDYYYFVLFTTSAIIAAMSPVTVVGNLLVVFAIWRNESLRSPTFFLLGSLSLEYFLSGLIFQPSYAAMELAKLRSALLIKTSDFLYVHLTLGGFGTYTTVMATTTTTLMAMERWLYMTRRRRVNSSCVRKIFVASLFQPIPLVVFHTLHILTGNYCQVAHITMTGLVTLCFFTTSLTYLQHQQQVQASATSWSCRREPFINMTKYKTSVFTLLLILALFYLSYLPFGVIVILHLLRKTSVELIAAHKVSVVLMFASSALTPCLYCWRIREIRVGVRQLLCNVLCKHSRN